MKDFEILDVLCTMVSDAIAASTAPLLPPAMPGRVFTPPNDQKYLEVVFIPNNDGDGYGESKNFRGMLRLILHWPNDDAGALTPGAVLASICAPFVNGRAVAGVQLVGEPNLMGILPNGTETLYPAGLRYNSFRP